MATEKFLSLSTSHLSPAARAWLSESATANHAANFHGDGNGAKMGTCAATLYGFFFYAPTVDAIGYAMPDDLLKITAFARSQQCGYILADADACTYEDLPIYDDDGDLVEDKTAE
jgi:hypothetical protein